MIAGRIFEQSAPLLPWDRTPVRAELFGAERLEQHAGSLAAEQRVSVDRERDARLANRLADNAAFLLQANRSLAKAAEAGHHTTPAAEWLADNYHLVDMQIREIGIDLPPGFYAQLPKLSDGPFKGLPRVFNAAWALVAHTDDYEGRTSSEICLERPDWRVFRDGCLGGVSVAEVSRRADRLIRQSADYTGNVAMFTGGQFGCSLAIRWIGLPVMHAEHLMLDTASVSILTCNPDHPGSHVIAAWNRTCG